MKQLALRYKFKSGTYDCEFRAFLDGTDEDPVYEIRLSKQLPAGRPTPVLTTRISGELAHCYVENDQLFNDYVDLTMRHIEGGLITI